MFRKILLCSDGSPSALHAAKVAAGIARQFHAQITLISVFNLAAWFAPDSFVSEVAPDMAALTAVAEETHQRIQRETGQVLSDAGVCYQSVHEMGHPASQICIYAQREQSDLIVLGSRGLSQWQGLFLGSVADSVLHHAPCPVWIVRGKQTTFDKILVAWDGSSCADRAVHLADEIAQQWEVPLTALNVVEPLSFLEFLREELIPKGDTADQAQKALWERLRCLAEGLRSHCCPIQEGGHPAETIMRYAQDEKFPLIVMGSRGQGSFQALTLGSVSNRVTHLAHCSLLVVR
jgi:nucleotide-binding universal stress UspA family protein